jgi:hypothetical protein
VVLVTYCKLILASIHFKGFIMKLLETYKAMLEAAGMVVNLDGSVSVRTGETTSKPINITGKRIVIPTTDQLNNPDWSERIAFHPLSENVVKGESIVMTRYRRFILTRMNDSVYNLMKWMVTTAASPKKHATLTPDQAKFLSALPEVSADDETKLLTVLENAYNEGVEDWFIDIRVVKGGSINGVKNVRTANVFFDFYTNLVTAIAAEKSGKAPKKYYGEVLSNKLVKQLVALVEFLIPNVGDPAIYNAGVTNIGGTFCEAFMLAVEKVGAVYDNWFTVYHDKFDGVNHRFVTGWVEVIHNTNLVANDLLKIPNLSGSENGVAAAQAAVAPPQHITPATPQGYAAQPPTQIPVATYPAPAPVVQTTGTRQPESFDQAQRRKAAEIAAAQAAYQHPPVQQYNPYAPPAPPALPPMVSQGWVDAFKTSNASVYNPQAAALANRPYANTFNPAPAQNNGWGNVGGSYGTAPAGYGGYGGGGINSL